MSTRRQFIGAVAAGLAGLAAPARAQAPGAAQAGLDGWPARSVRVISPSGTGGPGQNFRLYAEQLKDTFGQSFVLENMPGGSGAIGSMTVARAAPDGLTLLLASNSHIVLAPLVLTNSPVNVKRDYAAIALMFTFPFLLVVNPDLPVRTLKELVAYAKARRGELNYGSPGVGTGGHLVTELLVKRTGIEAVHVPYQGTTQQLLAAGTLQFTFDTVGNARGLVEAGKVIPLAVTGAQRASAAPDVPTLKELGYDGFDDLFVANGLLAPTGTSPAVIKAINREMVRMNASGPIREKLLQASYEPGTMSPEEYGAMIDRELKLWGDVVQETGVRVKA
jgi:tripartite-type tricarboxylate transporter receptor subunit TctC